MSHDTRQTGYRSPFARDDYECFRLARMLAKVDRSTRELLEAEHVSFRVARWVAGGHSRAGCARRAEVALWLRGHLGCAGWPEVWRLAYLGRADDAACADRRRRGLSRPSVDQTCSSVTLPTKAPPSGRLTKRAREALKLAEVREQLEQLARRIAGEDARRESSG